MYEGPILLVEDNPDDVLMTRRALTGNHIGNDVVVAADGEAALDLLLPDDDRPPLDPYIVLLDLSLPKVDGLEVLRRIRADERTALLPVIVLTASGDDAHRSESYRLGANSFVHKPVIFEEFHEAAGLLGQFWLVVNVRPPGPRP